MKRIFDILLASIFLIIFFIPVILICLLIFITLGKPIFFRQKRIGLGEKVFEIIKLRTMSEEVNTNKKKLEDVERLSNFGRFLRFTSLDELPEVINVLIGDMSFVGPRPLLPEYLPYYSKEERLRHAVLPGITGLAQVEGRNSLSWEEKFAFDIYYVKNQSLILDLVIIFRTLKAVVLKKGISPEGSEIMPRLDQVRKKY